MMKDFERSIFPLGEAFYYGYELVDEIDGRIIGSCAGSGWDMGILAQAVFNCGDRDYLEIGSHFGGSLIVAGKVKEKFGLGGGLISIDPYAEDYPWHTEKVTGYRANPAILAGNVLEFGLEFKHIKAYSSNVNWFEVASDFKILGGVIYVDGDHSPNGFDWDMKKSVEIGPRYIVVDNADTEYPHIVSGVIGWSHISPYRLVHMSGITAVLERMNDVS